MRTKTRRIEARVEWAPELKYWMRQWLRQGMEGTSNQDDRKWFGHQLALLEADRPDPKELANFLMEAAGFTATVGSLHTDFTHPSQLELDE